MLESAKERGVAREVDWEATALLLLERASEPALVISREGTVVLANQRLLKLLRRTRDELSGAPIDEVMPPAGGGGWPLEFAMRGTIPSFDCRVQLDSRCALLLSGDLAVVGSGASASLLAVVTSHGTDAHGSPDLRYEVSLAPVRGVLRRVWESDGTVTERFDGALCYQQLGDRSAPCPGCPLFDESKGLGTTAVVSEPGGDGMRLVSTRCVSSDTAEITTLPVADSLISDLVQAKVGAIAAAASLTERERTVLQYILLARSADEIGAIVGISARTVKFHQANLLEKIGAESRLDLLRLIL